MAKLALRRGTLGSNDKLTAKGFYNEIVRPFGLAIFFILLLFPVFFGAFLGLMANSLGIAFFPPCWMFGILGLFIC